MAAGKNIKRLRELAGISAENLSKWIGVGADKLRKWEQRDSDPREQDRKLVEDYFDCPINDLDKIEFFNFWIPQNAVSEPEMQYRKDVFKEKYYELLEDNNTRFAAQEKTIQKLIEDLDLLLKSKLTALTVVSADTVSVTG